MSASSVQAVNAGNLIFAFDVVQATGRNHKRRLPMLQPIAVFMIERTRGARLAQSEPAPKPDKIHFDLAVVVMVAFVMVLVAVVMVLVPPAMPPVVMMSVTIVISVTIPVAVPIPSPVSIPIAVRGTIAVPGSRTPRSAARGDNVAVRSIRRNAIVPIHVLHSAFHAANLALIVGLTIALPA